MPEEVNIKGRIIRETEMAILLPRRREMKFRNAVELFNDSIRRSRGMDHDGNEATVLTGLGGLAASHGIEYLSTQRLGSDGPGDARFRAAKMLREWADVLEEPTP